MGLSNKFSHEAGGFSHCCLNPTGVFSQRFEALFPRAGALGCVVCYASRRLSGLSVRECGALGSASGQSACPFLRQSGSRHGHASPLHSSCQSPPLLPVWMNVSSLTSWLSDFAVRFSCSSGYFLFSNLLLSFWLCEEAKCIYLCLHLGQKS